MGRRAVSRRSMRRWALPGVLIALLIAGSVYAFATPESAEIVGVAGMMIGQISAGVLILRRSRNLERRERAAWRVFAAALILAGTGVFILGLVSELGVEIPAFGPFDAFFLASYTLLIVFLFRLARSDGDGRGWLPTILDALVGAIALSALVWSAFFRDLVQEFTGAPTWELMIAGTYPVLDVAAVIGLIILIIRRSHFHLDPRLLFFALGLSAQVYADFSYLSSGIGRTFAEAQPNFGLFLLATACYIFAAAGVDRTPGKREFPEHDSPIWAYVWPYLLAGALLATHVARYRAFSPGTDELVMLDALVIIGVIVFFRQVLMIHRNRVEVEKQRSDLVASVSHELRTPLTAMVGYLTVLDEDGDEFPDSARREMISEASEQARHMARLVSDLVMLAKGDHRHLPLEIDEVAISTVTTTALRMIEPAQTRIEEDLATDARVRVDPDRLQQALSNMLSNAIRYGGDRALLVASIVGEDLVVEVHDNGEGVPTRYEAIVWRRFERGAHRLNAATPGLGIGLAIVEAVAESHGGRATYRLSERTGGACFSLMIPGCVVVEKAKPDRVEVST